MAIAAIFRAMGMTAEQYDESIRRLESAGEGAPPSRRLHVSEPMADAFLSVDVWDSEEQLARFGSVMAPIVAELGLTPPQPEVYPLHNMID